jgi:hypothetical protein
VGACVANRCIAAAKSSSLLQRDAPIAMRPNGCYGEAEERSAAEVVVDQAVG